MEKKNGHKEKENKPLLPVIILAVVIAAVATVFWVLSGNKDNPADTVVFTVGEESVYLNEVNLCILQNVMNLGLTRETLDFTKMEDGISADEFYKREILQVMMNYKVGAAVAGKRGMTLSEEEEQSVKNDAVQYMGKVDGSILSRLGITRELVIEVYRQRYLAHRLEEEAVKDVELEGQNYCTMYMLLFPKVLMNEEGNYVTEEDGETPQLLSEEEIEQKKEDADAAYKELLDGEDIEKLAEKYGVSNISGEESNLAESFGEPFSTYAGKLKKGEYSPVLETASCYAILKMLEENNQEMADRILEEYKADMEEDAVEEERTSWYEEAGISEEPKFSGKVWDSVSLYDFVRYVEE